MAWLVALFGGAIVRYIIGGAFLTAIIGAFWLWHSANYVQRGKAEAEISKWKDYSSDLEKAAADKERIGKEDEKARLDAEDKIEELEKENERLYQEDKAGDSDGVLLDRNDLKRLRKR